MARNRPVAANSAATAADLGEAQIKKNRPKSKPKTKLQVFQCPNIFRHPAKAATAARMAANFERKNRDPRVLHHQRFVHPNWDCVVDHQQWRFLEFI